MVSKKTVNLAQVSLLAALIVVLQLMSYGIKIGTFNLSLVLIPLVVGGVLFGVRSGALLGGIFGVQKGCNGGLLIFMTIIVTRSILSFMRNEGGTIKCLLFSFMGLFLNLIIFLTRKIHDKFF